MILYCKDSLGCIDNNNIELINNIQSFRLSKLFEKCFVSLWRLAVYKTEHIYCIICIYQVAL